MKRARYTEEQILGILQEHDAGAKCVDLCRKHGMSEGTFYTWKSKFSGVTVSDAKRLWALEDKNARLKKPLAEQMLDTAAMKELLAKVKMFRHRFEGHSNGRARREARSCRASAGRAGSVRAVGLPDCRSGPKDGALPVTPLT